MQPTLVFVYNADTGLFNTLTDIAHKVFAPETYSCNLCAITYGAFSIRTEWKEYLESLAASFVFLHRDELASQYPETDSELPAIFHKAGDRLIPWISATEINACGSIDDLKQLISSKLASSAGTSP